MIQIIWEFRVKPDQRAEFEKHYRSDGSWAELFRRGGGYRGTRLLQDGQEAGRYLTIDAWDQVGSFDAFKKQFAAEYQALDKECEALTESERLVGVFTVL